MNLISSFGGNHTMSGGGGVDAPTGVLFDVHAFELFVAVAIFVTIRSLRQKKRHGLAVWPVVGMLPSLLLALRHDIYEWITDVLRGSRNSTFVFRGPVFTNLHCVVTSDPRNLEYLLKTRFLSFPKGEYFRTILNDLLGKGIFNADDDRWRRQRKVASIEFHSAGFRAMTAGSLVELVHGRLLPVLDAACEKQHIIDLQDVLLRLTFDNVCLLAFGVDPGCLSPDLPDVPFAADFENATSATVIRFITPTAIWKALRYLQIGPEKTLRNCLKGIDDFAYGVIETRKKEFALDSSSPSSTRNDLLSVFMGLKDDDGSPFSEEFLRDICVNFILAGRDTSSVALAWFFLLLNRNPVVEDKILKELGRILRERELGSASPMVFRPEEVKKMEYLQAAISESLRLYPSVPVDHKEVVQDEVFPDGTMLKKGTKVLYAIYSMGRMEHIWGKDCREYKPERWMKDGRYISESAYKFTAFNGGPRLCLGKDFAYYQMKFAAASILHRYHVKVVNDNSIAPKLALTMYMKDGLKVKLERRRNTCNAQESMH